jgi:hypothetical protein
MPKLEINISKRERIFRCIILVVFYLQLKRGFFESKHNCLMLLSLFKLTTCFGLCTGIVRYITKYFCVCNHPDSVAIYRMLSNACFGLQLHIILLISLNYCDVFHLNSTVTVTDSTPPLLVLGYMTVLGTFQYG